MKRILLTMAVVATMFASCTKETNTDRSGANAPIAIDPTITRATEVDFETGDQIGVTITTSKETYVENKKFIFGDNKKFTAEDNVLWYEDVNEKSSIFAYYPYNAVVPTEFTVAADQNGAGYGASDFMSAQKSDVLPSVKATPMTFRHKMVRLIINIINETEFPVEKIVLKNTIGTGSIDMVANTITAKEGGALLDITSREITPNVKYYALVIPQSVKVQVAVTTGEGTRLQGFSETLLETGKSYPLTVRVLPKDIILTLGGPIDAWEDGDELIPDGQNPPVDSSIEYGGVKYKTVVMKDGRVWMASNLCFVPEGVTPSDDPTVESGMWYPQILTAVDDVYTVAPSKDADYIKKVGYYYTFAVAAGVSITADNYDKLEGVRGICPEGWHIPTLAEMTALFEAYKVDGASQCAALDEDGFNVTFTQMRQKNTSLTNGGWSSANNNGNFSSGYIISSTANSYTINESTGALTNQNKNLMFMNLAANKKFLVSNGSNLGGMPLRCIKDKIVK